jgi:serine/threonine protein phosphatase PrpC
MTLAVSIGHHSAAGGERNQDFVGAATPSGRELAEKGVAAAIADGVSACELAHEASEYAVRGFLADYYATPDTWDTPQALEKVLAAINRWLLAQGATRRAAGGLATTIAALVLRGRQFYLAHAGDSRAYLYRAGALRRLTADHVWEQPGMRHVLRRALGLDARLTIDCASEDLAPRDVFLLVTDGVWATLKDSDIGPLLGMVASGAASPDEAAERMVDAARAYGSRDDASALVLRVDRVPEGGLRDALAAARRLPVPPRLKPGAELDGLRVEELLHKSLVTLIYRVRKIDDGAQCVLKTLTPERGDDPLERAALAHEEWLVRRLTARFFPQIISRASDRQSCLYVLTTWHAGATLQQHLDAGRHFSVPEVVAFGERLARAAGALHRRGIVHRDIKPANVHLGDDGELRVIDFGLAQSSAEDARERAATPRAGTPSYLAPEQFAGAAPSPQADLYAAGVTLYHLLTRRYPQGEIEPFQTPRFGDPVPPTRYRPDVPAWLENLILKAIARDPAERFETAEEMLLALERGAARPLAVPRRTPLAKRNSLRGWQAIAAAALLLNLLLLFLLLR